MLMERRQVVEAPKLRPERRSAITFPALTFHRRNPSSSSSLSLLHPFSVFLFLAIRLICALCAIHVDISQSRLEELMSSDDDGTDDIEAEVAGEPDIEDDTADLPQE